MDTINKVGKIEKNRIKDLIYKEYEENGLYGAYDWAYEYNETHDLKIPIHWCEPCDNHTPSIDNECCCCGSDSL